MPITLLRMKCHVIGLLLLVAGSCLAQYQTQTEPFVHNECTDTCYGRADGQYIDCDNCYGFIMCTNNRLFHMPCAPMRTVYDGEMGVCVNGPGSRGCVPGNLPPQPAPGNQQVLYPRPKPPISKIPRPSVYQPSPTPTPAPITERPIYPFPPPSLIPRPYYNPRLPFVPRPPSFPRQPYIGTLTPPTTPSPYVRRPTQPESYVPPQRIIYTPPNPTTTTTTPAPQPPPEVTEDPYGFFNPIRMDPPTRKPPGTQTITGVRIPSGSFDFAQFGDTYGQFSTRPQAPPRIECPNCRDSCEGFDTSQQRVILSCDGCCYVDCVTGVKVCPQEENQG